MAGERDKVIETFVRQSPEKLWRYFCSDRSFQSFLESRPYVLLFTDHIKHKEIFIALCTALLYFISSFRESYITDYFGFYNFKPVLNLTLFVSSLTPFFAYLLLYLFFDLTIGYFSSRESKRPLSQYFVLVQDFTYLIPILGFGLYYKNLTAAVTAIPFAVILIVVTILVIVPTARKARRNGSSFREELIVHNLAEVDPRTYVSEVHLNELGFDSKSLDTNENVSQHEEYQFFKFFLKNILPVYIVGVVIYGAISSESMYPELRHLDYIATREQFPYLVVRQYENEILMVRLDEANKPISWKIVPRDSLSSLNLQSIKLSDYIKRAQPVHLSSSSETDIFRLIRNWFEKQSK